ncbi:MAG: acyltransferase [Pandoraea sp.]|nr:MAG: acyltransferase [Pandoraea sp.]TAM16100.1 MAG: acyltransferase [Pandoraea sp.]
MLRIVLRCAIKCFKKYPRCAARHLGDSLRLLSQHDARLPLLMAARCVFPCMRSSSKTYYEKLDHLRLFAATLVLLYHTWAAAGGPQATSNWLEQFVLLGNTGVTLFLVLSGFLFTLLTDGGNKAIIYPRFLANRALRIFPLLTVLFIGAMAVHQRDATVTGALSFLLFSNLGKSPLFQFSNALWTVAVECQFYIMFPFLIRFAHRQGAGYLIGLAVFWIGWRTVIATLFGASFAPGDANYVYFTMLGRFDQFLIGMIAGLVHLKSPRLLRSPYALGLGAVVALCCFHLISVTGSLWKNDPRCMPVSALEALLWAGLLLAYFQSRSQLPAAAGRALAALGQCSYSLYLLHIYVVLIINKYGGWVHLVSDPGANAILNGLLLVWPPALLLSYFSYRLIEAPFLSLRTPYTRPSASAGVAPPVASSPAPGAAARRQH